LIARQAAALFCASAVLGPLCDGLHSKADVLHYHDPSILVSVQIGGLQWGLESCWWVPLLFGGAGVIIGVGVPLLDELEAAGAAQQHQQQPQQQQQQQQQQGQPSPDGVLAAGEAVPGQSAVFCLCRPPGEHVQLRPKADWFRLLLAAAIKSSCWDQRAPGNKPWHLAQPQFPPTPNPNPAPAWLTLPRAPPHGRVLARRSQHQPSSSITRQRRRH
jgi:hypothetical protein